MLMPGALQNLIAELSKMPTIGLKSAQKLAFTLIKNNKDLIPRLNKALLTAERDLTFCSRCFIINDSEQCVVCDNPERDKTKICVLEEVFSVYAVEESATYNGLYHVLGGAISPIKAIHPGNLTLNQLLNRVTDYNIEEVIIATNPTTEGEATAYYIKEMLKLSGVSISRLAVGIPNGSYIEYTDNLTLAQSFKRRTLLND